MADLIELIKVLRDRTGAGLMDCKGALLANDNDVEKASDWLREKGLAKAAKKASRIAAEGLALVKACECGCATCIAEVNCETDFVAKGDAFKALVMSTIDEILKTRPTTVEAAKDLTSSLYADGTVKMGEKLDLRRFEVIEKQGDQAIYSYIHMGGKIASVVVLEKEDAELGKGLAMHIAANNPLYMTASDISADEIEHEKAIQMELVKNDPKLVNAPADRLEKILEGKVNKHFVDMVLDAQAYLLDDSKTVGTALKEKANKVVKFVRYQVGEGIEKRQDDFASEVMSQVK